MVTTPGGANNTVNGDVHGLVMQVGKVGGDVNMTSDRSELELVVTCARPAVEIEPAWCEHAVAWAEGVRETYAKLADAHDWTKRVPLGTPWNMGLVLHYTTPLSLDRRSREEYERHVEYYLSRTAEVMRQRAFLWLERHEPAAIEVVVRNPTDRNFAEVELELHIEGDVHGFDEAIQASLPEKWPKLPPRPAAPNAMLSRVRYQMGKLRGDSGRTERAGGWSTVNGERNVLIRFVPFDLRPGKTHTLPLVPLVVRSAVGSVLVAKWSATATNADGQVTGTFELQIDASTLDVGGITGAP